jgi:hypothetical protein
MHWHNRSRIAHPFIRLSLLVVLSAALALSFGRIPAAHAASLIVTNSGDGGPGTLRQAIAAASSGDTITFALQLKWDTIGLVNGPLDITKDLTILVPAGMHVTISGAYITRVVHVASNTTVRLENLRIIQGVSVPNSGSPNGGGIANDGTLTVVNSTFSDNHASIAGAAIYNTGTLTVIGSTFTNNIVNDIYPVGAAIANYRQLTVANSTFSDNRAIALGDTSLMSGVIYNYSSLRLSNSTFAENGTVSIRNTGVAVVKNTLFAEYGCSGSFSPEGTHNLAVDQSCGPGSTVVSDNAFNLGPLQDNGGATQTFALLPSSPAIDAGDAATCAAAPVNNRDQRGLVRPQGSACDIGAFEVEHLNVAPIANNDSYLASVDTPLKVDAPGVLANDTDPDNDVLHALLSRGPSHGQVELNADGSFYYIPEKGFTGTDTFVYKASDGGENATGATVTITVAMELTMVMAKNDNYTVNPGTLLTVVTPGVLANDTPISATPLSAQLVDAPTHGELSLAKDGSFQYTPQKGFKGVDQFTYLASDGYANSNIATVTLTVQK